MASQDALTWTTSDAGEEMPWSQAERHCADLRHEGRDDWRLPEIDELEHLYDAARTVACGEGPPCHLKSGVELRGAYVWSATEPAGQSQRRYYFDYRFGTKLAPQLRPTLVRGVLCVRGRAG